MGRFSNRKSIHTKLLTDGKQIKTYMRCDHLEQKPEWGASNLKNINYIVEKLTRSDSMKRKIINRKIDAIQRGISPITEERQMFKPINTQINLEKHTKVAAVGRQYKTHLRCNHLTHTATHQNKPREVMQGSSPAVSHGTPHDAPHSVTRHAPHGSHADHHYSDKCRQPSTKVNRLPLATKYQNELVTDAVPYKPGEPKTVLKSNLHTNTGVLQGKDVYGIASDDHTSDVSIIDVDGELDHSLQDPHQKSVSARNQASSSYDSINRGTENRNKNLDCCNSDCKYCEDNVEELDKKQQDEYIDKHRRDYNVDKHYGSRGTSGGNTLLGDACQFTDEPCPICEKVPCHQCVKSKPYHNGSYDTCKHASEKCYDFRGRCQFCGIFFDVAELEIGCKECMGRKLKRQNIECEYANLHCDLHETRGLKRKNSRLYERNKRKSDEFQPTTDHCDAHSLHDDLQQTDYDNAEHPHDEEYAAKKHAGLRRSPRFQAQRTQFRCQRGDNNHRSYNHNHECEHCNHHNDNYDYVSHEDHHRVHHRHNSRVHDYHEDSMPHTRLHTDHLNSTNNLKTDTRGSRNGTEAFTQRDNLSDERLNYIREIPNKDYLYNTAAKYNQENPHEEEGYVYKKSRKSYDMETNHTHDEHGIQNNMKRSYNLSKDEPRTDRITTLRSASLRSSFRNVSLGKSNGPRELDPGKDHCESRVEGKGRIESLGQVKGRNAPTDLAKSVHFRDEVDHQPKNHAKPASKYNPATDRNLYQSTSKSFLSYVKRDTKNSMALIDHF